MPEEAPMRKPELRTIPTAAYGLLVLVLAIATFAVLALHENIVQRQCEARQDAYRVVPLSEEIVDPAQWGRNYPFEYDTYRRTVDTERTRYGGSEAWNKLEADDRWRTIWAGMAFATDYREDRGHAYMLVDQRETERVKQFKQPGACLHCHASVLPAYYQTGVAAGVAASDRQAAIRHGFEIINAMPYAEATELVDQPITCNDCHDPANMALRVTRPAFLDAVRSLARSDDPLAHLPSIGDWRQRRRAGDYDPNTMASRQEMRSMVCAQCHVEYYFAGEAKKVTYPWSEGLTIDDIFAAYESIGFSDWQHKLSGAAALKAQHPEFELWSQGVHAANGVACADCHMPYVRLGAVKVSDHHVRSPMLNVNRACQTCHNASEADLLARVNSIQERTERLMDRATDALVELIHDVEAAQARGAPTAELERARALQRRASFYLDYVSAENSMGFHAPQEAVRIVGEAIDYARQGQLAIAPWALPRPTPQTR